MMRAPKVLYICACVLAIIGGCESWRRRRRRRRCDSTPCQWNWGGCSRPCGGGTQSPVVTRRQGSCGACNLPGARSCNNHCCPVNCVWGSWGSWGGCSRNCGGGSRTRSRSVSRSASCGGSGCSGSSTDSQTCNPQCCPVNCAWGSWGSYGSCSASCAGGTQSRSRSQTRSSSCGGTCSGSSSSTRSCNTHACPVDCRWGSWGSYDACSLPCGSGSQSRTRSVEVSAQHGGDACPGSSFSSRTCNTHPCPIDCRWSPWSAYGKCSIACGGGTQVRSRGVSEPAQHGGAACSGTTTSSQACNTQPCPINCVLGNWGAFGACSALCGGGSQSRTRTIVVKAQHGGQHCTGDTRNTRSCNEHPCPINCVWGPWGELGDCSVSCGGGTQSKMRSILVTNLHGGLPCVGSPSFSQACNGQPCPVDCVWGKWGDFGACSATCGGGRQSKSRKIVQQLMYGGLNCTGLSEQSQECNTQCCPVDCQWGPWSEFNACPVDCGSGTQVRNREVTVAAECGGQACQGEVSSSQVCNTHCCPVDCQWESWGDYGQCSATCGGGEKMRQRRVATELSCGGKSCPGSGEESAPCNTEPCPVDCVWGNWTQWGECSVTCGGGSRTRTRKINVAAKFGGAECIGEAEMTEHCNENCCPVHCEWGDWIEWSSCSQTCGKGAQSRFRSSRVMETCGGIPCAGNYTEERFCNDGCCPVDCVWGEWTAWGVCSQSCGSGVEERSRKIVTNKSCNGADCIGKTKEKRPCNTECCPVDCVVSAWGNWSTCPKTCGVPANQARSRSVVTATTCGGRECPSLAEVRDCDMVCYNGATATATACLCQTGWKGLCCNEDIDECSEPGSNPCPLKSTCVNTVGSFVCECDSGYAENADSICENIDECFAQIANCHKNGRCVDSDGSFQCVCVTGYEGNGTHCWDKNECEMGTASCQSNAQCLNTDGSYSCECMQGFVAENGKCADIDECSVKNSNDCDENAECENSQGSYECYCNEGWSGDGKICTGIDECAEFGSDACQPNAVCSDLPVGYQCDCMPGYTGNAFLECKDIDECANPSHNPCPGDFMQCKNTAGSYECMCPDYMGLVEGHCVELPPSLGLRMGDGNAEATPSSVSISVQKLVLYVASGSAGVLILALVALRIYKTRAKSPPSDSGVANPVYSGEDSNKQHSENPGFIADEIDDDDL